MRILLSYGKREYDRNYADGFWRAETFAQALRAAVARTPDKLAIADAEQRLTFTELLARVQAVAAGLRMLGIGTEDVVSVQLPNSIELAVVILALLELGAVYNPLNPGYRRTEIENILGVVRPRAVLCRAEFRGFAYPPLFDEAAGRIDSIAHRIVLGPASSDDWLSFSDLETSGRAQLALSKGAAPEPDPDAIFLLGATSGTTGHPKVYIHTAQTQLQEARRLVTLLGLSDEDVFLAMAPMAHRGALMFGLCTAVAAGATLHVVPAFAAGEVLPVLERERVTAFMAIPTQVVDLLHLYEREKRDLGSLRMVLLSGAPVADSLVDQIRLHWPTCIPITGYGLSETGYTTLTRRTDPREKLFTSGRPVPGMEVRIMDEQNAAGPGTVGEIQIRGPQVCAGYFDNQAATRAAIDRDGWFSTGDLGLIDQAGYLHPVGRLKHVIIRGGMKIYAEEVEFMLGQHPSVAQAVVVPLPDQRLGERACACIVPRTGKQLDLEEVRRFLSARGIAKFMVPEAVQLFPEFPVTPVGKVDRRAVLDQAQARALTSPKEG